MPSGWYNRVVRQVNRPAVGAPGRSLNLEGTPGYVDRDIDWNRKTTHND